MGVALLVVTASSLGFARLGAEELARPGNHLAPLACAETHVRDRGESSVEIGRRLEVGNLSGIESLGLVLLAGDEEALARAS